MRLFLRRLACVHQEDRRLSLASQLTSQECACKCTVAFYLQVSPLHFIPFGKARHCSTVRFLRRSRPALVSLTLAAGATHPAVQDALCGLGFALWLSFCSDTPTRFIGQDRTLLFPILFVVQVPAQLT